MKPTIAMALAIAAIVALCSTAFAASCSADAYRKACSSCSFDASGKIDEQCMSGYKSEGTACLAASYPIMAAKYGAGECSAMDSCISELQSCTSQYSSGNDSADCQEGSVAVCYSAADSCALSAAPKCGEVTQSCPGSSAGFILLLLGMGFAAARGRKLLRAPQSGTA